MAETMTGELRITYEFVEPGQARGEELRATWAALRIEVVGAGTSTCLTNVVERRNASVRERIYAPLYPLAEWIVANWYHILYEPEGDVYDRHHEVFIRRHNLMHAGDGFFYPSVLFVPSGDADEGTVELIAADRVSALRQFISSTADELPAIPVGALRQTLSEFIDSVANRLLDSGITATLLQQEWELIRNADGETAEFCMHVAAAGLDPNDIDQPSADRFESIAAMVPKTAWTTLFTDSGPDLDRAEAAARTLRDHSRYLAESDYRIPIAAELRRAARRTTGPHPWQTGYQTARDVRSALALADRTFASLDALLDAFGFSGKAAASALRRDHQLPLGAVVGVNRNGSPGILMNGLGTSAGREAFLFCRAMSEYLSVPADAQRIVSRARNARQKENRAFAAEFLAPSDLLRDRVNSTTVGTDEVDDLARHFGVSQLVIAHQLQNHRIATIESV